MISQLVSSTARASAERIFEILDDQPEIRERPGAVALATSRGHLCFEDVGFAYPGQDHAVLRHVAQNLRGALLLLTAAAVRGHRSCGRGVIARRLLGQGHPGVALARDRRACGYCERVDAARPDPCGSRRSAGYPG